MNKVISDYIYWKDDTRLTGQKHKIYLDNDINLQIIKNKGTLRDGRNVENFKGKWYLTRGAKMNGKTKELLKKLEGKDLSRFGVRAEATLKHFIEDPELITKKDLEYIEKIVKKYYT